MMMHLFMAHELTTGDKWAINSREMQGLPVGAFVEGELHLS
jgi:hypothetical protein